MYFFLETLRLGVSSLRLHKMRSLLTVLGIVVFRRRLFGGRPAVTS